MKPEDCFGEIVFSDVNFNYPSRPNAKILKNFFLTIQSGETLALVGQSGRGKSTCIQLFERFYNEKNGKITLDGTPLNQINIKWLRNKIGLVQQEPILFNRTIRENILYGTEVFSDEGLGKKKSQIGVARVISFLSNLNQYVFS